MLESDNLRYYSQGRVLSDMNKAKRKPIQSIEKHPDKKPKANKDKPKDSKPVSKTLTSLNNTGVTESEDLPSSPSIDFDCVKKVESIVPSKMEPLRRKGKNQHTQESMLDIYTWLISNCHEVEEGTRTPCWVPDKEAIGIQIQPSGYYRISINGAYYMAHKFAYCMATLGVGIAPPSLKGDISHLCHRQSCCRPDHLTLEDHNTNVSRNGCSAYLLNTETGELYCVCKHTPNCITQINFSRNDLVNNTTM